MSPALWMRASSLPLWQPRGLALAAGIALGVSLLSGLASITDAAAVAFRATLEGVTGRADLRVRGGEAGLSDTVLETVRGVPEVAVATPVVRGTVFPDDEGGEPLAVVGIDLLDDEAVRLYQGSTPVTAGLAGDPLLFLGDARSVVVSAALAARRGLAPGTTLRVVTPHGARPLTVRGILPVDGRARLDGDVVVMDLYAAQRLLGRRGRFDAIDVVVRDHGGAAATVDALRRVLPPGVDVVSPGESGTDVRGMLATFCALIEVSGWLALVLAAFFAFGAAASATAARRRSLAVLRAVGATRSQVLLLMVGGVAVLGVIGAAAGVVLGHGVARLLKEPVLEAFDLQFARTLRAGDVALVSEHLVGRALVGVLAAVAGAALPVWQAARVPVLTAWHAEVRCRRVRAGLAARLGAVLVAGGLALAAGPFHAGASGASTWVPALLLCGAAPLVGPAFRCGASAARAALVRLGAGTAVLASASGRAVQTRLVVTGTGLALAVALLVDLAALHASVEESVQALLVQQIRGDLVVSSAHAIDGRVPAPLAGALAAEMATLPGVTRVVTMRSVEQPYRGERIRMRAVGGALDDALANALVVDGDPAAAAAAFRSGAGVLISRTLALRQDLRVGDPIGLETPRGARTFAIAGVVADLSSERGTVTLDRRLYRRWWGDDLINVVELSVAPEGAIDGVISAITRRFGRSHHLQIRRAAEHRQARLADVRRAFAFTRVVEAFTLLVMLLALADNLLASVHERGCELAILRALGATRRQLAILLAEEALLLGLAAGLFGLALGSVLAVAWLRVSLPALIGFAVDFHFPWGAAVRALGAALLVAAAATCWPAWRATRVALARELRMAS